ncbi:MAG TPA: flagellar biosynthesis protein FlhB [Rhizomicrobium sp.]|nr:flagellar biosynthesis protein FlhB [Rhizomicrobium sp.]
MAEDRDSGQATEEPTQRRLDEAQAQGDIVKSQEVSTFIVLGGGTLAIAIFGQSAAENFVNTFRVFIEQPDQLLVDPGGIMNLMRGTLYHVALIIGPPIAFLVATAFAAHLLQHRPSFAPDRLIPDFGKVSPQAGLKRLFSLDSVTNLLKGLAKLTIVGIVVWTTLWPMRGQLGSALDESPAQMTSDMMHLLMRVLVAVLSVLAVVALADYFLQRMRFIQRNRMTKQEVKEEFRQNEGDPLIKARIRKIRMEKARKRMMAAVPNATVVITNPTHYAVALQYEQGKMDAPLCVAKGVDALALRIRAIAEENKVPVIENPPLARALYATVEIDESIPPEHYKAVAQVIGYVLKLTGKRPH